MKKNILMLVIFICLVSFVSADYENDAYTKLMLHMDGDDGSTIIPDSSPSNHGNAVVVGNNAQLDTSQKKFGTASLLLGGGGDYAYFGDSDDWYMDKGPFTIDFWVRFNALPTNNRYMVFFSQSFDREEEIMAYLYNASGTYIIALYANSGSPAIQATWTTPAINTWYHIAFIRGWGNDDDAVALTIDGSSLNTEDWSGKSLPDISASFAIGHDLAGHYTCVDLNGWVDEFRVSKGIARWTSDFTPPTPSPTCCPADNNPTDGVVSIEELINYISRWKSGSVIISELIIGIGEWKNGC